MVKLRVAARVIPETDYNHEQSSTTAGRKFLVVVRNPEDWYIGHLAVEIQRTYKRIYKQYDWCQDWGSHLKADKMQ